MKRFGPIGFSLAAPLLLSSALLPQPDAKAGAFIGTYEDARTLAQDPKFRFAAAVEIDIKTGPTPGIYTASGVVVAPTVVLIAGHFTPPASDTLNELTRVFVGDNYKNPSSGIFYEVVSWQQIGSAVTNPNGYDYGLAFINPATPVLDPLTGQIMSERPRFSDVVIGQQYWIADFGKFATLNGPIQESLGDKLAGMTVAEAGSGPFDPNKTSTFDFAGFEGGKYQGLPGSSGAAIFALDGSIASTAFAAAPDTGPFGYTYGNQVNDAEFQANIQPHINASFDAYPTPEPVTAAMVVFGALTLAVPRLRNRRQLCS